jgi:hypothetical protein
MIHNKYEHKGDMEFWGTIGLIVGCGLMFSGNVIGLPIFIIACFII